MLKLKNITKKYKGNAVFSDFSIAFRENAISCILGPSGCGKTTLLNIMGNVILPDGGVLEGFQEKRFSYVFQAPRLIPWKTVAGNIDFVLDREISVFEREERVKYFMNLVELSDYADYYPSQLSGGMCQRVSIARAFVVDSDVIFMDEPFSGLDVSLKEAVMERFLNVWEKDKRTVVCVTHDVDEALALGEEIFVFSKSPVNVALHREIAIPFEKRKESQMSLHDVRGEILRAL